MSTNSKSCVSHQLAQLSLILVFLGDVTYLVRDHIRLNRKSVRKLIIESMCAINVLVIVT